MNVVHDPVKGLRPYRSPVRAAQAAATKSRLLDAAQRLFAVRGYLGTTMADIAADAAVATPTVFAVFGSKPRLLSAAIAAAVRGEDTTDMLLRDRPAWHAMLHAPTAAQVIENYATIQTKINARAGALIDTARIAAQTDPALADLTAAGAANRWSDCHDVVTAIAAKQQLPASITLDSATDILWTVGSAEIHRMLVVERHWTIETYQHWLSRTIAAHLLDR